MKVNLNIDMSLKELRLLTTVLEKMEYNEDEIYLQYLKTDKKRNAQIKETIDKFLEVTEQ